MSMSYWICEGIGIRTNQLRPFLNTQKCIQLLKEQLPGEEISEDGFDIDDYLYGTDRKRASKYRGSPRASYQGRPPAL